LIFILLRKKVTLSFLFVEPIFFPGFDRLNQTVWYQFCARPLLCWAWQETSSGRTGEYGPVLRIKTTRNIVWEIG